MPPGVPAVPTVEVILKALPAVGYTVLEFAVMVTPLVAPTIDTP